MARINLDKALRRYDSAKDQWFAVVPVSDPDSPERIRVWTELFNAKRRLIEHLDKLIAAAASEPEKPLDPAITKIAASLGSDHAVVFTSGDDAEDYLSSRISRMSENRNHIEDGAGDWFFGGNDSEETLDQLCHRIDAWEQVSDRLRAEREAAVSDEEKTVALERRQRDLEARERWGQENYGRWLKRITPHIDRMAPALAERHGKALDQMKRFLTWHGDGIDEWVAYRVLPHLHENYSDETVEQMIWEPVAYNRAMAEQHRAEADRGDQGSVIDWDDAVRRRWEEFEQDAMAAA